MEKKQTKKRCPNGERKNKKTGECEPIIIAPVPVPATATVPATVHANVPANVPATVPVSATVHANVPANVPATVPANVPATVPVPVPVSEVKKAAEQLKEPEFVPSASDVQLNNLKKEQEMKEWTLLKSAADADYDFLYPALNDPNFNIKITERKEFFDNKYDGTIYDDISKQADIMCMSEFELAPQQLFVRNFLSMHTPYNSLLLYHGLGSGKTCSAIGVAEEMRDYNKQMGVNNRIIVVASPNVQDNFKVQLFDSSKLKAVNGIWNINSCTGNKFLKEINPMNMTGLSAVNISAQINQIINKYYSFMGYFQFANEIIKTSTIEGSEKMNSAKRNTLIKNKLQKHFSNSLIIIDEVHNIRQTDDNPAGTKKVASELRRLIKNVDSIKLLLLSATPMYNSYKEIIWLINLMNENDQRATIELKDVFDANGNFKMDGTEEIGKELLERKATGYISYVRGENPYTFPYRLWPTEFSPENTFNATNKYPQHQLNGMQILQGIDKISLFLATVGEYQQKGYDLFIKKLEVNKVTFDDMESFGYSHLQKPLQALNMVYPHEDLDNENVDLNELVGETGLRNFMKFEVNKEDNSRFNFEYKNSTFGNIFAPNEISKYSGKIKNICDRVINSTGIVLIYTQYIDGGIIPIALALEELGFTRGDSQTSLFKPRNPPIKEIDALTLKPRSSSANSNSNKTEPFSPAKYIIVTGDKGLSPNNADIIKKLNEESNKDGRKIKVVLISQAGSEGLDYKCIRQVHILDPWYNMSRIEQIIGRAVRTCSHRLLPFSQRNVEIYLYGSLLREDQREKEAVDLYVYRLSELKAVQIGNVSRVLKEVSVDCILNADQSVFTVGNIDKIVEQTLSSKKDTIMYKVGDKPFSALCDYRESCNYICNPNKPQIQESLSTYNEDFIMGNTDKIIQKIKKLMKDRFFYKKTVLITMINLTKIYSLVNIYAALNQLIEDKNEYIVDKYGRLGNLINIGDLYLFQPIELKNKHISVYERIVPIEIKHDSLTYHLPVNVHEMVLKPGQIPIVENMGKIKKELETLLVKLTVLYTDATTDIEEEKIDNKDWYKLFNKVMKIIKKYEGINENDLLDILVEHILDELTFEDYVIILNGLMLNNDDDADIDADDIRFRIKKIIDTKIIKVNDLHGILVSKNKNNENQLMVQSSIDAIWTMANQMDAEDFKPTIEKIKQNFIPMEKMNNLIGFMTIFKDADYKVFKVKDLSKKKNKGARCDQSTKQAAMKLLLSIVEEDHEYIGDEKDINRLQICIMQEIFFRLYNRNKKDNKIWFLSPVESNLCNIENL